MESLVTGVTGLVVALAVFLFFGPIVVMISIMKVVTIKGNTYIDLSGASMVTRVLIATIGLVLWLTLYIPIALFIRAFLIGESPSTHQPTTTITEEQQRRLDERAVLETIDKDVLIITQRDLSIIEDIYTPNSITRFCMGTLEDTDDLTWIGIEETRERFREALRLEYRSFDLVGLSVEITGEDRARAWHEGVVSNGQFHNTPAEFELQKINDVWKIVELRERCD